METTEAITITVLCLGTVAIFLLLIAVWRVGDTLLRVERLLKDNAEPRTAEPQSAPPLATAPQRTPLPAKEGAFAEFLATNPETRKMSKNEQAEAFRKWRKERGLNWSGS
ncbi:MAG: hypothetical protein MUF04_04020 [Akkermansiaceae bacterium]|nr:hypothetical protein [Akkermansiaceae bacterium]